MSTSTSFKSFCVIIALAACSEQMTTSPDKMVPVNGTYSVTPPISLALEVLAGGAHGNAVNEFGVVVGDGPSTITCAVSIRPILWRADGIKELLPLGPYCGGAARGINQGGTALGALTGAGAVIWVPSVEGYVLQALGPAFDGSSPITKGALNDANEVVGWVQRVPRLYWWSATTGWTDMVGPANATECQVANGINNRGEIVGKCTIGGLQTGYYWASHTAAPIMLPRPAATGDVNPSDINDSGIIVGYLYGAPGGAWRWTPDAASPSGFRVERLPDAGRGSAAFSIAADGTIAGDVNGTNGKPAPAFWPQGGAYRMLPLTSKGSWGETSGTAVTATGGVIVTGTDGNQKALRWK